MMADAITYKDNAELYEKVEDIPGEKAMLSLAAKKICEFAKIRKGIEILDFCCGTSPILEHFDFYNNGNILSITGVDISKEYLDFARHKYYSILAYPQFDSDTGIRLNFIQHDAVSYTHCNQVDAIICSSAYHHIEDERKIEFLRNVKRHLKKEGIVVFCENLLKDFSNDKEYFEATKEFYDKRIEELKNLGINDIRLQLLERVKQYGLDEEYEYKASMRIFKEHLTETGFKIISIQKVWPDKNYFSNEEVGDFVIVAGL